MRLFSYTNTHGTFNYVSGKILNYLISVMTVLENFTRTRSSGRALPNEQFKPLLLRPADGADLGRAVPGAQVTAHLAAPDRLAQS